MVVFLHSSVCIRLRGLERGLAATDSAGGIEFDRDRLIPPAIETQKKDSIR